MQLRHLFLAKTIYRHTPPDLIRNKRYKFNYIKLALEDKRSLEDNNNSLDNDKNLSSESSKLRRDNNDYNKDEDYSLITLIT